MANIKFSAFTQKVVTGNVDFLVGYTGGDNVRISPAIFSDTYLPLAGGTMIGNTIHNDNVKSIYGTSSDGLEIYHNGSNSFISDTGTGLLVLSTNTLQVYNAAVSEYMITATENGAVELYYDGVKKFETTATGVTVTGDVIINKDNWLQINTTWGARAAFGGTDDAATFARTIIRSIDNSATSGVDFQNYAGNSIVRILDGGNVGIGVTNPSSYWANANNLVVGGLGAVSGITIATDGNLTGSLIFADGTGAGDITRGGLQYDHSADDMIFRVDDAERMRIDSAGKVGIGTDSPASIVHIANATNPVLRVEDTTNNATVAMYCTNNETWMGSLSNHELAILTNDIAAITIDTSQNITITGAYTDQNGVRTFSQGGVMVNDTAYDIDITVDNDTGTGTVHHITAMMTHYSTIYGCVLDCYAYTRAGNVEVQTDLLNQSNAEAGGWTVSKPDTTTLRLTKSAGTYTGAGNYQVVVVTSTPT